MAPPHVSSARAANGSVFEVGDYVRNDQSASPMIRDERIQLEAGYEEAASAITTASGQPYARTKK